MKTLKTIFVTIILLAILLPLAGLAFIYSGVYNIAATEPHNPVTHWLISATVHRSIEVHSQGLEAPALNNPQLIQAGFDHYREDCTGCHTAPGASISEFAQGFYPKAPDLAEEVLEMSSEQLFWVIKHGIKMTAMPAWGPTHTNEEIWSIVAFVKQLPNISAVDYQHLEDAAEPDEALESPAANQRIPEQSSIEAPDTKLAPNQSDSPLE